MGDILPSAITTMAQAAHDAGITVDSTTKSLYEAMEAGEVMSEDVLPHFGKRMWEAANRGGALQEAINNTGAAYGRLGTNIRMANKTFNEAGLDKGMRRLTNSVSEFLLKSEGLIKFFGMLSGEIASRFGVVFEVLETFGVWSTKLGSALEFLEEKGLNVNVAFMVLSGTLAIISKWFRRIFMFVYLLPWALSLTADTLKGEFGDDLVDTITRVVAALMTLYGALKLLRTARTGMGRLFGGGSRSNTSSPGNTNQRSGTSSQSPSTRPPTTTASSGWRGTLMSGGRKFMASRGNMYAFLASVIGPPIVQELMEGNYQSSFGPNADQRFIPPGMNLMTPEEMANRRAGNYLVQGGITINVDGAGDPQVVSEEVLRTIQNVFRETASLEPETEQ